jgi:hypothetical protein
MAAISPLAPGGPAIPPAPVLPAGPPSWREVFASAARMFIEPAVNYGTLSVSLFASTDAPDILLSRVESLAQRSPVIMALISDEEPERITLLKNPNRLTGSLANPSPLDGLVYGFAGSDSRTLAAVHLPSTACETSAAYNVLDDPVALRAGLGACPPDQTFHAYVNAGTPDMTNSSCRRALVLPMPWYADLAAHPDGISHKVFYDQFLVTGPAAERPNDIDTFTWRRHTAPRAAGAEANVADRANVNIFRRTVPPHRLEHPASAHDVWQPLAPGRPQPSPSEPRLDDLKAFRDSLGPPSCGRPLSPTDAANRNRSRSRTAVLRAPEPVRDSPSEPSQDDLESVRDSPGPLSGGRPLSPAETAPDQGPLSSGRPMPPFGTNSLLAPGRPPPSPSEPRPGRRRTCPQPSRTAVLWATAGDRCPQPKPPTDTAPDQGPLSSGRPNPSATLQDRRPVGDRCPQPKPLPIKDHCPQGNRCPCQ